MAVAVAVGGCWLGRIRLFIQSRGLSEEPMGRLDGRGCLKVMEEGIVVLGIALGVLLCLSVGS